MPMLYPGAWATAPSPFGPGDTLWLAFTVLLVMSIVQLSLGTRAAGYLYL